MIVDCDPFTGLSTKVSSVQPSISSSSSSSSLGAPSAFISTSSFRELEGPAGGAEERSPRADLLRALADCLA